MRFFFYGTLIPSHAPPGIADVLRCGKHVAPGSISGRVYGFPEYPAGLPDPATSSRIHGDVFEFPDDENLVRALDVYEECDLQRPAEGLYVRREVEIDLADGRRLPCWMYVYNRDVGGVRPIPNGNYSQWLAERTGA